MDDHDPPRTNHARWIRALALVTMVGGYVAYVRANDAEASAIFDAGGDAGMWAVGIIVATALLIPGAGLLLVSLALTPRANRSRAAAAAAGIALLVPTAWLTLNLYPPDRKTDEGLSLAPAQWSHVADLYLAAFVLLGVAGTLLLVSALPSLDRRGQRASAQSR